MARATRALVRPVLVARLEQSSQGPRKLKKGKKQRRWQPGRDSPLQWPRHLREQRVGSTWVEHLAAQDAVWCLGEVRELARTTRSSGFLPARRLSHGTVWPPCLSRLPRVREPSPALGIWGLEPARLVYQTALSSVRGCFDWASGGSSGGCVAGCRRHVSFVGSGR